LSNARRVEQRKKTQLGLPDRHVKNGFCGFNKNSFVRQLSDHPVFWGELDTVKREVGSFVPELGILLPFF
jgi:hypothetical protein